MANLGHNTCEQIRRVAGTDKYIPVDVVLGDKAPECRGSLMRWIVVGQLWLDKHYGREQWQADLLASCF